MNSIRIIALFVSTLCGSFMFYQLITNNIGFYVIYLLPIFLVSSICSILIPAKISVKYINKYLKSFVIWAITLLLTMGVLYVYNWIRNISPVIYAVEFYSEEGVFVDFRENGTFRAHNTDLLSGSVTYGKYENKDTMIILLDELKFGNVKMNDTLKVENNGFSFTLEKSYRNVKNGKLTFRLN